MPLKASLSISFEKADQSKISISVEAVSIDYEIDLQSCCLIYTRDGMSPCVTRSVSIYMRQLRSLKVLARAEFLDANF